MTTFSSDEEILNLKRPATALLSYAHEDAEEVKYLQLQLKVHGVQTWRDETDLPDGILFEDEIVDAIEKADAFIIYITPQSLASDFVWRVEIRAALNRRERDPIFNIVPILRGVSFAELQQQCVSYGYRSLTDFHAEQLPDAIIPETDEQFKAKLRVIAGRVLKSSLTLRFRRIKANQNYEPWIRFCTFSDKPQVPALDLDLDWWDFFQDKERLPSAEEWRDILFPALMNIKNAFIEKHVSHNLHLSLKTILPVAFVFGYTFRATTSFTLVLESKDGPWTTAGMSSASPSLRRISYNGSGDKRVAVIEITITGLTAKSVSDYLSTSHLSYGHHIRYDLVGGPDFVRGVKDADHALAIAQYIGKELRELYGQGITHFHLFAAIPVALAVLLGHQFNALCPISLYEHAHGQYEYTCVLGAAAKDR
ncbi:MAG TPA: SAVED domain-containing protein [Ktedonobacteraceae bacterium]|nr:SAVED domain-containing protein [Ktedonobacteraceae bacterium]